MRSNRKIDFDRWKTPCRILAIAVLLAGYGLNVGAGNAQVPAPRLSKPESKTLVMEWRNEFTVMDYRPEFKVDTDKVTPAAPYQIPELSAMALLHAQVRGDLQGFLSAASTAFRRDVEASKGLQQQLLDEWKARFPPAAEIRFVRQARLLSRFEFAVIRYRVVHGEQDSAFDLYFEWDNERGGVATNIDHMLEAIGPSPMLRFPPRLMFENWDFPGDTKRVGSGAP